MVNTVILENKEELYSLLPTRIQNKMLKKQSFLVGAVNEKNELIGIATFSFAQSFTRKVRLEYLYVLSKDRDSGVSAKILDYASSVLKEQGIQFIDCMIFGKMEKIANIYEYLRIQEFEPLELTRHLMEVKLSKILHCAALQPLIKKKAVGIKKADELDRTALRSFMNTLVQKGAYRSNQDFDRQLSRFYEEDSKVLGCMLILPEHTRQVTMFLEHMEEDAKYNLATPAMLADCAVAAGRILPEDTLFKINIHNNSLHDALCKVLGEPEQDNYLQQYRRKI